MMRPPPHRWLLPLLLATAACAAPGGNARYPSLLPRAIETRSDAEAVAASPAVAAPDAALDAKLATLRHALDEARAGFAASSATAERAATAARGDAVGGERWITAQAALADLDALRATTASLLTEIDDLAIARATAGAPPYPALEVLRGDAQVAADAQGARIGALQSRLPGA